MNFDSILFDLDGTLWDATKSVYDSWTTALQRLPDIKNIPTTEQLESVMGMTDLQLMKTLFPYLEPERAKEIFDLCCEEENAYLLKHGAVHYNGVTEVLEKLSQTHKLAIVSNCNTGYIDCYMDSMGTKKYITDTECFGNTRCLKGENIKLVIERNGFKKPVYVGDTKWDMEAADYAGIPFIYAAYGFGDIKGCPMVINKPMDLVRFV